MVSSERGQPLTDSCSPPSHYSYGPRCIYHISMNLHDKSFTSNPPLELPRLRRWYRMDTAERFWLLSVFPRCLFCLLFMTMVIAGFVLLSSFGIAPVVHARGLKMKRPRTKVTNGLPVISLTAIQCLDNQGKLCQTGGQQNAQTVRALHTSGILK